MTKLQRRYCVSARRASATFLSATDLVAGHAVLFHLLKLALELRLPLYLLLRAANVNGLPVHLFAVHLVHSLQQTRKVSLYMKKVALRTVVIDPVLQRP